MPIAERASSSFVRNSLRQSGFKSLEIPRHAALLPELHQSQPRGVRSEQREAQRGAFRRPVEQRGQKSRGIDEEQHGSRQNKNNGKDNIHTPIICPCPAENNSPKRRKNGAS